MKSFKETMKRITPGRALAACFALAWAALFFSGALPVMKMTHENTRKIESASAAIASMTAMSAAGGWFEAVVRDVEPGLMEDYGRLFPPEKGREDLFLELARIAGDCGIEQFVLREIPIVDDGEGADGHGGDPANDSGDETAGMMVRQYAADVSGLPETRLRTFRLSMNFDTEYGRAAEFVSRLGSVPRALRVRSLDIEQNSGGVTVTMELDYYAQWKN